MATKSRSRGGNRGRNNNPEGRNQYSGIMETARDNPLATAAVVGGAVAAGIFLWSRRDQIEYLAYLLSEWREGLESDGEANADRMTSETSSGARTQAEISEEALTLKEIGKTA